MPETMQDFVRQMEGELGIPKGFLWSLKRENDWSLVIKAHAMIESSLSHIIAKATGRTTLAEFFANLPLGDTRAGKIVYAEALGILETDDKRFIRGIAELRNDLVHDVRRIHFTFRDYVKGMNASQLKRFEKWIGSYGPADLFEYQGRTYTKAEFIREHPKDAFWQSCLACIAFLYLLEEHRRLELERLAQKKLDEWARALLPEDLRKRLEA